jgi:ribosomal protein S18 acetylase RimI-like enzyme
MTSSLDLFDIGQARVRDAEALLKLQYLCYQTEAELYDDYRIPPLTQTLWSLLEEFDTHEVLAVRFGDEVVGSVRGLEEGGTCYVGRLIVHPRFRRRGLATRLLREIEDRFAGADRFELFTGHLSESNLRLYNRLGYAEFRRETASPRLQLVYLAKPCARI